MPPAKASKKGLITNTRRCYQKLKNAFVCSTKSASSPIKSGVSSYFIDSGLYLHAADLVCGLNDVQLDFAVFDHQVQDNHRLLSTQQQHSR